MRRLVCAVGIFLGFVIVCLAFLRAVQLENMLPLASNDVGYINFRHTSLSTAQIDEGLAQLGKENGVELLQLSGTVGTREVTITSRAANQPPTPQAINFFRPGKTGTLYPAAQQPDLSRSGIYAVKGDGKQIVALKTWLSKVGAIHTWENFTLFQTYFLPLAYQGIILILAVAVFLVTATIFGWFTTRADSRTVRLSAGYSKTQIVNSDSITLVSLVLLPASVTILISFTLTTLILGVDAFQLVLPLIVLFICTLCATAIAVTIISYMTFPRLSDWVERRSLVAAFSWVGATVCAAAIVFSLAALPIVYRAFLIASDDREAARQASYLPEYHYLSFGGIVEEQRDYDPFVAPFAKLTSQLENKNQVFLFKKQNITPEKADTLLNSGYESIVIVTPNSLAALEKIPNGCRFNEITDSTQIQIAHDFTTLINPQIIPKLKFFTCKNGASTIAIAGQGIFTLANKPLVVLVPSIESAFTSDIITSIATLGAIVFHDSQEVISQASSIGLNLTSDSTADSIAVYAQDQQLGYYVSLASIVTLIFAAGFTMFISAQLYAASRLRSLFPLYIAGKSISSLIRLRIVLDFVFISFGTGCSAVIASALGLETSVLYICICSAILFVTDIALRHYVTRTTLTRACQRKS